MAHEHMKRCSTLPLIREKHIKIIMKYHLTPIRMATIRKTNITNVYEHGEKLEALCTEHGNVKWCSPYEKQDRGSLKD